ETIAASDGSATGEYLARVLRGEPLVPLSDVTFADEAGRGDRGNGHAAAEVVPPVPARPSRKRATETAKAR
ncbi:MAG TPA: hypothetical protein VIH00_11540, partial [Candidatus Limnocylindrales bacterium]